MTLIRTLWPICYALLPVRPPPRPHQRLYESRACICAMSAAAALPPPPTRSFLCFDRGGSGAAFARVIRCVCLFVMVRSWSQKNALRVHRAARRCEKAECGSTCRHQRSLSLPPLFTSDCRPTLHSRSPSLCGTTTL